MKLSISRRAGIRVIQGIADNGDHVEVVSNAYPGNAYMNGYLELKEECERLLGFKIHKDFDSLVKDICG